MLYRVCGVPLVIDMLCLCPGLRAVQVWVSWRFDRLQHAPVHAPGYLFALVGSRFGIPYFRLVNMGALSKGPPKQL